ncbi:MAG: UPF0182 family protein [Tissierellia bacterium]|nr:UPF0182 family protein [Tissierellia bacterium]
MNKKKYIIPIVIILFLIVISSFDTIISFVTDYQWFNKLGYRDTFLTKLNTQIRIGLISFTLLFVIIYSYLQLIKKKYYIELGLEEKDGKEKWINRIFAISSAFIAYYGAFILSGKLWFNLLLYINRSPFNIKDPIFNKDLSFYIFTLPFYKEILSLVLVVIMMLILLTFVTYIMLFSVRRPSENIFQEQEIFGDFKKPILNKFINKRALKEALLNMWILGSLILAIQGINFILNKYMLLYSNRGVIFGAGFTDVKVTLKVYWLIGIGLIISAVSLLIYTVKGNMKRAIAGPLVLIGIFIIGNIAGGLVQRFIVEPDEVSKEEAYIEHHIEFTQRAYGLDKVEEKEFPVSQNLTKEDLANNKATINNIRINDYRPIAQAYNQLQAIRLYYTFNDVDIDRYYVDGEYTQVFLSARELDQKNLQNKTWINKHLKYTHGYGLVLSPVNAVTSSGQPDLLIKNIPPVNKTNLNIDKPEIYFGESTNEYIIVNTDEMEFDYPEGSDNKQTKYEGAAGIRLGGINKLLFALKERDYKILISNNIKSDSRIIVYRNIMERIKKIAPFIDYDDDPYIVINQEDGKLYWIIDGYTTTDKYPYSKPYSEKTSTNYIRNSVKVVVDAYNGTTRYYIFDGEDPIIQTYRKIFPDLFLDKSQMPEGLMSHIRYPINYFDIQAEIYKTYHIGNPMVFYNEEDLWDIAQEKYMTEVLEVEPTYVMFKLPDEEEVEFLLTVPYTPRTKPNMTSLFVARNDGEDYGKLFIYKFPKGETVDGPMMVESRIDQTTSISEEMTLWSQQGSRVLRGNMIIVPIESSLLYVEPIYLVSDNENSLPEMKRVVLSYKDQIVMEETLDKALNRVFNIKEEEDAKIDESNGEKPESPEEKGKDQELPKLIQRAIELFNKAKEASQSGNWADYGEYINELERVLKELEKTY